MTIIEKKTTYKSAKAIYLISGLGDAYFFLYALVDSGAITEEITDSMLERISKECAGMTMAEIDKIKAMF